MSTLLCLARVLAEPFSGGDASGPLGWGGEGVGSSVGWECSHLLQQDCVFRAPGVKSEVRLPLAAFIDRALNFQ